MVGFWKGHLVEKYLGPPVNGSISLHSSLNA